MRTWDYKRIFADRCEPSRRDVRELLSVCAELERWETGSSFIPAGYTYLGQFIDHDLSLLAENTAPPSVDRIGELEDVSKLTLARKPALDLDSVYGGGLEDSVVPFDRKTGKFILGKAGSTADRDLPRDATFRPLIVDERNDENLLIAQIQVLFMNLHNRIADSLNGDAQTIYQDARAEVVKIYQYLVLHDFLRVMVRDKVYTTIVLEGRGRLTSEDRSNPTLAIEATDAVFRLHSMVRESYDLNDRRPGVGLRELLGLTGRGACRCSGSRTLLEADDEVDWRFFFPFADYSCSSGPRDQAAKRLSVVINDVLKTLTDGRGNRIDMVERNILRGLVHGLPSGRQAIAWLTSRPDLAQVAADLDLIDLNPEEVPVLARLRPDNSIRRDAPLWVHLMSEAPDGLRFGPLGEWLLADTLLTAALSADIGLRDPQNPSAAELFPGVARLAGERRSVRIEDVIMYTYDYPCTQTTESADVERL